MDGNDFVAVPEEEGGFTDEADLTLAHLSLDATKPDDAEETDDERRHGDVSEVDVTTVSNNDLQTEDEDLPINAEFLGSSLSGRSIYAPPRVKRLDGEGENKNTSKIANIVAPAVDCNNNCNDDEGGVDNPVEGAPAQSTSSTTSSSEGGNSESSLPEWKRKLVEKRREEMKEKEREREKWESIPEWRRKLLDSKSSKDRQIEQSTSTCNPPAVGDGPVSGARFWGVTLKKTSSKQTNDPGDADREEDGAYDHVAAVGDDEEDRKADEGEVSSEEEKGGSV